MPTLLLAYLQLKLSLYKGSEELEELLGVLLHHVIYAHRIDEGDRIVNPAQQAPIGMGGRASE